MKLNFFSQETAPRKIGGNRASASKITFGKTGSITLNRKACNLIGLKPGDKITLAQDEHDAANWYIFKDEANGFPLRNTTSHTGCIFNHAALVTSILDALGFDDRVTHTFLIAGQPTTTEETNTQYWGILIPQ